jgi:hypothetical protein
MLAKIELDDLLEKPVEGSEVLSLMREELAAMKASFDTCHELMKKLVLYDPPKEGKYHVQHSRLFPCRFTLSVADTMQLQRLRRPMTA